MKAILLLPIIILLFYAPFSQCNVQTNQREDGVTVRYLRPDRIGFCDRLILALSMQTNGKEFFVSTLSVFETNAVKLKGKLILKFANDKSSTLEHYRSEITTYNGYPATISTFLVDASGIENISSSNITMAVIQLADNVYQSVPVKMNGDILKRHYDCLK
jgi:hypothetical protein